MSREHKDELAGPYQAFMLVLCSYAVLALVLRAFVPLRAETVQILTFADVLLCVFFFIDFLISLVLATNRWRYLWTWGWVDLLSSIPAVPFVRWGRLLRIARLVRVLRTVKAVRTLLRVILSRRAESTFMAVALIGILVLMLGSVSILEFERVPGGNIKTPADACWFAFATMTTVGYGDRYPVTDAGRLVGAVLMLTGVGLMGTFAGFVASWFTGQAQHRQDADIKELRDEVRTLREALEKKTIS